MLLPSLAKSRESAKKIRCSSNLRQMGTAIQSYVNDYDGWLITRAYSDSGGSAVHSIWKYQLSPYLMNSKYVTTYSSPELARGIFACPSFTLTVSAKEYAGGYGWNRHVGDHDAPSSLFPRRKLQKLSQLSETIFIADSTDSNITGEVNYASVQYIGGSDSVRSIGQRHSGGANVLWGDSHVSWDLFNNLMAGKNSDPAYYFKIKI